MEMCKYCEGYFNKINYETDTYSGVEICLNNNGELRVRVYPNDAKDTNWLYMELINVNYCPMCGRKFNE